MGAILSKTLQKQVVGWIRPAGYTLPIPALCQLLKGKYLECKFYEKIFVKTGILKTKLFLLNSLRILLLSIVTFANNFFYNQPENILFGRKFNLFIYITS